ncbi:MAG: multiheme c-type cytochrome [Rhodothermales bacterium]
MIGLLAGCSQESIVPFEEEPPAPLFRLSDFSSAESCKVCHPTHYDEWRGSMHAYSIVDPIHTAWLNGLRESLGAEELGQMCVQCHSPIGMLTGETPIGFKKEELPPIVREGVTCDVCHLMTKASTTTFTDAVYHYDAKSGTEYGSIMDPVPNRVHPSEGRSFYSRSVACLPCHDLVNGNGLPVEITFTEWLVSPYGAMSVECQDCHMETYSGKAATDGPVRDNLHRHDFIGVDVAVLDDFPNKEEQRQKIEHLLQNAVTLTVECPDSASPNSTLAVEVTVTNDKTGHDVPSSVTFVRQMWVEMTVSSGATTLYESGYFDSNGDLMDENSLLNPAGDPDLMLFQSALFKDGEPANVVTADSIRIGSIAPLDSKSKTYMIPLPAGLGPTIEVGVRLRFRSFPPYAIRDGAAEFIDKIPVIDMETFQKTVAVR